MAALLTIAAANVTGFGNIVVSPDGLHASMTWLGPKSDAPTKVCRYQCGYCEKACVEWNANAVACCNDDQCCCCAPSGPGPKCTAAQCLSTSKGKCPSDMCGSVPPAPPAPPPAPAGADGLTYINAYRTANGKNALVECATQGVAQKICDYDAANGKHTYVKKFGYAGICSDPGSRAASGVGAPEFIEVCESNGYNGGDGGAEWVNAIEAMKQGCTDAVLLDNHTCASFGSCKDCTVSASGKKRNFYVVDFC